MVKWADEELPVGISVDSAKNLQPDYLTINWGNPDTLWVGGDSAMMKTLFAIVEIKGSQDILKMQNQLVFIDGKYSGRETRK
jgi:fructose-1,6-bisphosphatase